MDLKDDWCTLSSRDGRSISEEDFKDTQGSEPVSEEELSSESSNSPPAIESPESGQKDPEVRNDISNQGKEEASVKELGFEDEDEQIEPEGNAQEKWQRTNAYMRDVQKAFRTRPAIRIQGNKRYFKLLLVGEPGLGKELFIKNTFAAYCEDNDLPVNSCPPETTTEVFTRSPSDFCTDIVLEVDSSQSKIHYVIQDTPGTHMPGVEGTILKHIFKQSQDYMAKEEDPRRVVPLSTLPDPRVDAVLYFLSPHYLKPQDVELMTRLSSFVPLIPIIAKADALTTAELDAYRGTITEKLQEIGTQIGRPIMHQFSQEDLQRAGAVRDVPPFAVITSQEVDHEVGSHWFTRQFPWGKCEVLSSNHSDLPALKSLLFECCFESLKAATEARFYSARETYLTTRALSRALSSSEAPAESKPRSKDDGPSASPFAGDESQQGSRRALPSPALPVPDVTPTKDTAASEETPKAGAYQQPKSAKSVRAESKGWGWSVGWTVGVISVAIIAQLAAYRYYSKNASQLEAIISHFRQESIAERQVIADLLRELGLMHGDFLGGM